jgi:hypothetical protein
MWGMEREQTALSSPVGGLESSPFLDNLHPQHGTASCGFPSSAYYDGYTSLFLFQITRTFLFQYTPLFLCVDAVLLPFQVCSTVPPTKGLPRPVIMLL